MSCSVAPCLNSWRSADARQPQSTARGLIASSQFEKDRWPCRRGLYVNKAVVHPPTTVANPHLRADLHPDTSSSFGPALSNPQLT